MEVVEYPTNCISKLQTPCAIHITTLEKYIQSKKICRYSSEREKGMAEFLFYLTKFGNFGIPE